MPRYNATLLWRKRCLRAQAKSFKYRGQMQKKLSELRDWLIEEGWTLYLDAFDIIELHQDEDVIIITNDNVTMNGEPSKIKQISDKNKEKEKEKTKEEPPPKGGK